MLAMFHSNGQLRTERDGDTEKGCQKLVLQQKTTDDDADNEGSYRDVLVRFSGPTAPWERAGVHIFRIPYVLSRRCPYRPN